MRRINQSKIGKLACILLAAVMGSSVISASAGPIIPEWKRVVPPAAEGENVAVYFSNGDNEILFNEPPIDSPEAIDEVLDVLKKAYGVKRIYWRAPQVDQILYKGVFREEAAHHGPWGKWMNHLFADLKTGDYMISAAKARGMEVWGVAALFDHGSQAYVEYPTKGYGPFFFESAIRLKYPEAIPVDRAGIRRMSGPICFAYPEARKELVRLYTDLVRDKGYDGLSFQTYVENQGTRFDDEYGFNEPIVVEFKKRYGVDIRTEPYDREKLAELRGEYLTQFFRELREAMRPLNVKISVMLDAKTPDLPQYWLAFRDILLSGRITVDWRAYAREDLVDELFVYFNGDPMPLVRQAMKELGDTEVDFATLSSSGFPASFHDLRDAGVWRTVSGQMEDMEYGYHEPQPVSALDGDDFVAKLSVLSQMGANTTELDIKRVIAATSDESLLVRRQALRLLLTIGQSQRQLITPDVINAVIARLDDPQNIVRCTAVHTLGSIGDSSAMPDLYDAVGRHANPMMLILPPGPLATLPDERTDDVILGLRHPAASARIFAMSALNGRIRPAAWPALIESETHSEWMVRWNVARALENVLTPEALACLSRMVDDSHPVVRSMAVRNLSLRLKGNGRDLSEPSLAFVKKLDGMFAQYGEGSTRPDAEWGWRTIGEALDRFGPAGREVLERYLQQDDDKVLADRAWNVIYVRQDDHKPVIITLEEAEAGYQMHPSHQRD